MSDPIEQFGLAIAAAGLEAPDYIEPGRIIKFPGHRKSGSNKAAWCFMFDDLRGGVFGDYSTDMESTWQASNSAPYTPAERQAHLANIKAMQAQRDADLLTSQQHASETAAALLGQADTATVHPYLSRKGVQPHGVKAFGDRLLIPMHDTAGKLHSLQTITPDGDKRFHPGGRIKACYHAIGKPAGLLVVCEGYATGASIHEATGHAVAVAFNAGNLLAVATALYKKYPALTIVMAADDDWRTEGNPGLTSAKQAAMAVGGVVVRPHFPTDRPPKATDFNDLAALAGLSAVRACFLEVEVFSC